MLLTAVKTGQPEDLLFSRFVSSRDYLEKICSRVNEESKRQSIAGLHALLFLLERLGVDPVPLVLVRESGGRPFFANSALKFSLSHSGNLAVCALSSHEVGIDAELLKYKKNVESFAKRFFSENEYAIINKCEDPQETFFEIWTKKEAWLKSRGEGIDGNLAALDTCEKSYSVFDIADGRERYVVSVFGEGNTEVIGGLSWTPRK